MEFCMGKIYQILGLILLKMAEWQPLWICITVYIYCIGFINIHQMVPPLFGLV